LIADINSRVDTNHPALVGHLFSGYDFVSGTSTGALADMNDQQTLGFLDDQQTLGFLDDQQTLGFLDDQQTLGFLDRGASVSRACRSTDCWMDTMPLTVMALFAREFLLPLPLAP
jgi:hypothetical protein